MQSFGDYLKFHPHAHVLAAAGLIDNERRFHEMPVESIEPLEELFRHRFLATLRREKLISEKKLRQLLGWTHSGFNLDAGEEPVGSHDVYGRQRLAEYLLRAPFSLEKITWKESTGQVIYRSDRSWHTKCNFQIFEVRGPGGWPGFAAVRDRENEPHRDEYPHGRERVGGNHAHRTEQHAAQRAPAHHPQ